MRLRTDAIVSNSLCAQTIEAKHINKPQQMLDYFIKSLEDLLSGFDGVKICQNKFDISIVTGDAVKLSLA